MTKRLLLVVGLLITAAISHAVVGSPVIRPEGSEGDVQTKNGSRFKGKTLTAGSNITITTSPASISIAATASGGGMTSGATYYIQNTNTLQTGATFYVSSGTVQNDLNVGTITARGGFSFLNNNFYTDGKGRLQLSVNTVPPLFTDSVAGLTIDQAGTDYVMRLTNSRHGTSNRAVLALTYYDTDALVDQTVVISAQEHYSAVEKGIDIYNSSDNAIGISIRKNKLDLNPLRSGSTYDLKFNVLGSTGVITYDGTNFNLDKPVVFISSITPAYIITPYISASSLATDSTGKIIAGSGGGGGGGGSALEVFNNFDGTRSSPTASIGLSDAFRGTVSGSTYTFRMNTSSVTLYGPSIPATAISAGALGSSVRVSSLTAVTTAGTYGSATTVPVINFNDQGQIISVSSATISATGDNLGNHTATMTISAGHGISASTLSVSGITVSTLTVTSSMTVRSPIRVNGAATFDSTMYVANSFQGASFVTGEELIANGYSSNGAMIDVFDSANTSSLAPTYSGILFKYTPADTGFNTISQAYFSLRSSTPTVQKAHMVIGAGAIGGAGTTDYFMVDVSTVGGTIGNIGLTKALSYQGIRTISSFPFVVSSTDSVVIASCTAAVGCTVTLPAASGQTGQQLQFQNIALSTFPVYYRTSGSDLINGTTNQIATYAGMSLSLISDGVNRWISTSDLPGPLAHVGDKGDANAGATLLANYAYLFSVQIPKPSVITHMAYNVTTSSNVGTIDLGVYDSAGNRLGSTGAVVQTASTGGKQIALTAPAYCLVPGTYYLAVSANNATAAIIRNGSNNIMGSKIFATSHPLPASLNLISGGSGGSSIQYAIIGMTAGGTPF